MFYPLLHDWYLYLISFYFNFGGNTQLKGALLNWVILVILYKSTTLRKLFNQILNNEMRQLLYLFVRNDQLNGLV